MSRQSSTESTEMPPQAENFGPFDAAEISPERRDEIIDGLARTVVKRRLSTPALFFLEMNKPLSMVASTAVTFAQPTLGALFGFRKMSEWASLLRERENVDRLIQRIESLQTEKPNSQSSELREQGESHARH